MLQCQEPATEVRNRKSRKVLPGVLPRALGKFGVLLGVLVRVLGSFRVLQGVLRKVLAVGEGQPAAAPAALPGAPRISQALSRALPGAPRISQAPLEAPLGALSGISYSVPLYRRRTNVQQLTCNIDLSCFFKLSFLLFCSP